jgi:hypothetical protein
MRISNIAKSKAIKSFFVKLLIYFLNKFDEFNGTLTTYRVKRLETRSEITIQKNEFSNQIGILIQGQLVPGVTYQICKRYRNLYPKTLIVFSTWHGEQHQDIQRITMLGIDVIFNQTPKSQGPSNINLQVISTQAGLAALEKKGVKQVLKNRSDGILSSDYFLEYLCFLYLKYSENGKRIVVPGYNSFLFRLYSPTDQFQFGSLETLQKFWSCPLVLHESADFRFAESYLVRNYLSHFGKHAEFTIEDSLSVYRDYFVIADNAELGLVLNKGTRSEVSNRWAIDGYPQQYSELHFWNWLDLTSDLSPYVKMYKDLESRPNF